MVSNKNNKLMKQNKKSNRKINKKSNNKKSNNKKPTNKKSNKILNRTLNILKQVQEVSQPNYLFNKKDLEKIGGFDFTKKQKIRTSFKKVLKNLETGKDSSHTNKVVENGKIVFLTNSKFFIKFYKENKKRKEKVVEFDFYPYIIENNIDLFKDCCSQLSQFNYPDNIINLYQEVVSGENEQVRYKKYKDYFTQEPKFQSIFYIITANILIRKLHQYIPVMVNEPNKYLEIITNTHNANFPKLGTSSLKTSNKTNPSITATTMSSMPLPTTTNFINPTINPTTNTTTMIPTQNYNPLQYSSQNSNQSFEEKDPFNSVLNKLGNKQQIIDNKFGGNKSNKNNSKISNNSKKELNKKEKEETNFDKIRKYKQISQELFDLYIQKIKEPLSLKDNDKYKTHVKKMSKIKKSYLPIGKYEDSGFDFLKSINAPEYNSKYLDELENKIYHSLREARKYLNIYLVSNEFQKIYNSPNYSIKNNEKSLIKSIEPKKFTDEVANNNIFKNIRENIIKHYFNDNIKQFNESTYQFMDQSVLSNLGQMTMNPGLSDISNPLLQTSSYGTSF